MPDFLGSMVVKIQPNTANLPITFEFTRCTTREANDGAIPYADSIASAVVLAYDPYGVDCTSDLVTSAASVDGLNVSCELSYYAGMIEGRYKLTVVATLASGYVDEFDFKRVYMKDT